MCVGVYSFKLLCVYVWVAYSICVCEGTNAARCALSILYLNWFDTNPQSDLVTPNTVIYIYMCVNY